MRTKRRIGEREDRELRATLAATILGGILAGPVDAQLSAESRLPGAARTQRDAAEIAVDYADEILDAVDGSTVIR